MLFHLWCYIILKDKRVRGQNRSSNLKKEFFWTFMFRLLPPLLHNDKYQTQEQEKFISGNTSHHPSSCCTTKTVTNVMKCKLVFKLFKFVLRAEINEPYDIGWPKSVSMSLLTVKVKVTVSMSPLTVRQYSSLLIFFTRNSGVKILSLFKKRHAQHILL